MIDFKIVLILFSWLKGKGEYTMWVSLRIGLGIKGINDGFEYLVCCNECVGGWGGGRGGWVMGYIIWWVLYIDDVIVSVDISYFKYIKILTNIGNMDKQEIVLP